MAQSELVLFIVKLVLGGVAAFLAIMLWSRTRDIAWMCLVAGTVTAYAGVVYEMMYKFGLFASGGASILGIPFANILFASIPTLFYIAAFILMLVRSRL